MEALKIREVWGVGDPYKYNSHYIHYKQNI